MHSLFAELDKSIVLPLTYKMTWIKINFRKVSSSILRQIYWYDKRVHLNKMWLLEFQHIDYETKEVISDWCKKINKILCYIFQFIWLVLNSPNLYEMHDLLKKKVRNAFTLRLLDWTRVLFYFDLWNGLNSILFQKFYSFYRMLWYYVIYLNAFDLLQPLQMAKKSHEWFIEDES